VAALVSFVAGSREGAWVTSDLHLGGAGVAMPRPSRQPDESRSTARGRRNQESNPQASRIWEMLPCAEQHWQSLAGPAIN
jgi:hypothetical protein